MNVRSAKDGPIQTTRWLVWIALLSFVSYISALPNEFVGFDDFMLVLENRPVKEARLGHILCRPIRGTYLPVRALSYAAEYAVFGARPFWFHLTNVVLHTANSMLVLVVLRAAGTALPVAFAAASLFAVHAVHTEAVTWISGRRDVLFAFFYLIAFLGYVQFRRKGCAWAYVGSAAALLLSGLSKGVAVTFLPMIVAWDWCEGRVRRGQLLGYARSVLVFGVITAAMLGVHVTMGGQSGAIKGYHGGSLASAMHAMAGVVAAYARLLCLPTHLCVNYYFAPSWRPAVLSVVTGLAVLAGGFAFAWLRRRPGFWFWWALLGLLPVLNLVPIGTLQAERYLYLPSISFAVLLAWAIHRSRLDRRIAATALCSILVAHAALTCRRNLDWRNTTSLWRSSLRSSPRNPKGLGALALVAKEEGLHRRAERGFLTALAIAPKDKRAHLNLGALYCQLGRTAEAATHFRRVVDLDPVNVKAHVNLGLILVHHGRIADAARHARRATEIAPDFYGTVKLNRLIQAQREGAAPQP